MEMLNAIDVPMIDKVNATGGAVIAVLTYFLGEQWYLFLAFLLCNVIDYLSGVFKAKVHKTESSSAGLKGIVKKLAYWFMIMLSFLIGTVLNNMGDLIGADLSMFTPLIGWLTLASLFLNELRSILENLVELGVSVPSFLVSGLKIVTENVTHIGDKLFDGSLDIDKKADDPTRVNISTPREELVKRDSVTLKIRMEREEEE